jgi:non-ribosomal peptide synthetase component F
VQVGSEVDRSREDALLVLTLRLAVELLPPLRHEVQLGLEVNHNLNLLATLIETVAECGILEKKSPVTLKKALLGGEALLAKHVNIWKKAVSGIKITNLYGPTEVTVDCTYYPIEREFENNEPIPIGKACENMEVFLLDEN